MLERLKIKDFELFNDYVRKGLQPYNELGKPLSPADVMEKILDIVSLKGQLDHTTDISHDLPAADAVELNATLIQCKKGCTSNQIF